MKLAPTSNSTSPSGYLNTLICSQPPKGRRLRAYGDYDEGTPAAALGAGKLAYTTPRTRSGCSNANSGRIVRADNFRCRRARRVSVWQEGGVVEADRHRPGAAGVSVLRFTDVAPVCDRQRPVPGFDRVPRVMRRLVTA